MSDTSGLIRVGYEYPVGAFFWIDSPIGFTVDAEHGHGLQDGGSVDIDCRVRVLSIDSEVIATVALIRPTKPYGAKAAHGAIFTLSLDKIRSWPELIKKREEQLTSKRNHLAKFKTVIAGPYRSSY